MQNYIKPITSFYFVNSYITNEMLIGAFHATYGIMTEGVELKGIEDENAKEGEPQQFIRISMLFNPNNTEYSVLYAEELNKLAKSKEISSETKKQAAENAFHKLAAIKRIEFTRRVKNAIAERYKEDIAEAKNKGIPESKVRKGFILWVNRKKLPYTAEFQKELEAGKYTALSTTKFKGEEYLFYSDASNYKNTLPPKETKTGVVDLGNRRFVKKISEQTPKEESAIENTFVEENDVPKKPSKKK